MILYRRYIIFCVNIVVWEIYIVYILSFLLNVSNYIISVVMQYGKRLPFVKIICYHLIDDVKNTVYLEIMMS